MSVSPAFGLKYGSISAKPNQGVLSPRCPWLKAVREAPWQLVIGSRGVCVAPEMCQCVLSPSVGAAGTVLRALAFVWGRGVNPAQRGSTCLGPCSGPHA